MKNLKQEVIPRFEVPIQEVKTSREWEFSDAKRAETAYITHGYHRYPAKFIPQLARRLIEEHSNFGETVLDPFCGCGTTLIESIVSGRHSFGSDINPIAILITRAKTQFLDPQDVINSYHDIQKNFMDASVAPPTNERISYWFKEQQIEDLSKLLSVIQKLPDANLRIFYECAFSNILKNCSIWKQRSTKPTRDFKKKIPSVMTTFTRHVRSMMKGNSAFWDIMKNRNENTYFPANSESLDSRYLPLSNNSIDLVVTSPPYVTSYEYGDLHQLSMLWLQDLTDLREFRSKFIGSASLRKEMCVIHQTIEQMNSLLAAEIFEQLKALRFRKHLEVQNYYKSMNQIWQEMYRVVRPKGRLCVVIGNTKYRGVEIKNAEVFVEQLDEIGFRLIDLIKRRIPSKILPTSRDKVTGRFTKTSAPNQIPVYPTEFILILEKSR